MKGRSGQQAFNCVWKSSEPRTGPNIQRQFVKAPVEEDAGTFLPSFEWVSWKWGMWPGILRAPFSHQPPGGLEGLQAAGAWECAPVEAEGSCSPTPTPSQR